MKVSNKEINYIICETFDISIDSLSENIKAENIPAWDSMKHMDLISEIESRFTIIISEDEIHQLMSTSEIADLINNFN